MIIFQLKQEDYYFKQSLLKRFGNEFFCVRRVKIESTNVQFITFWLALLEIFRLLGNILSRLLKHPRVSRFPTQIHSQLTRPRLSHFKTSEGLGRSRRRRDIPASSVDDVVLVTAVR